MNIYLPRQDSPAASSRRTAFLCRPLLARMGKKRKKAAPNVLQGKTFIGKGGESWTYDAAQAEVFDHELGSDQRVEPALGAGYGGGGSQHDQYHSAMADEGGAAAAQAREEEEAELQMEMAALRKSRPERKLAKDDAGLRAAAASLQLRTTSGKKPGFVEVLALSGSAPVALAVEDVHDDLRREAAFFDAALQQGVKPAFAKLDGLGLKYRRPADYYAEMVKSDEQMRKIKEKLLFEKKNVDDRDERKRQRENAKFGKKVQQAKLQAKQKQKSAELDSIRKWRKERKGRDDENGDAAGAELDKILDSGRGKPAVKGMKRSAKDDKYGYGGAKRRRNENDATSYDDFSAYSKKRNEGGRRPQGKGGKGRR